MNKIDEFILNNSEEKFANFSKKLISSNHEILGVRLPTLRTFAKEISANDVKLSKDCCLEKIMLFAFASSNEKTEEKQLENLKKLLPFIDNWSSCDCTISSLKKLTGEKSYKYFTKLLKNKETYHIRVGIVGLMRNFIKSDKIDEICANLKKISIENADYYIKMALAWFYAELCISNYPKSKREIETTTDKFVRNKSISKARESFRVTQQQKDELANLRIK